MRRRQDPPGRLLAPTAVGWVIPQHSLHALTLRPGPGDRHPRRVAERGCGFNAPYTSRIAPGILPTAALPAALAPLRIASGRPATRGEGLGRRRLRALCVQLEKARQHLVADLIGPAVALGTSKRRSASTFSSATATGSVTSCSGSAASRCVPLRSNALDALSTILSAWDSAIGASSSASGLEVGLRDRPEFHLDSGGSRTVPDPWPACPGKDPCHPRGARDQRRGAGTPPLPLTATSTSWRLAGWLTVGARPNSIRRSTPWTSRGGVQSRDGESLTGCAARRAVDNLDRAPWSARAHLL